MKICREKALVIVLASIVPSSWAFFIFAGFVIFIPSTFSMVSTCFVEKSGYILGMYMVGSLSNWRWNLRMLAASLSKSISRRIVLLNSSMIPVRSYLLSSGWYWLASFAKK